jgi:hypothetical protein
LHSRGRVDCPIRVAASAIIKQRFIRVGHELADEVTVVVRGGTPDAAVLRHDALRNYAIYATLGIAVFAARDLAVDELAQRAPLIPFEQ